MIKADVMNYIRQKAKYRSKRDNYHIPVFDNYFPIERIFKYCSERGYEVNGYPHKYNNDPKIDWYEYNSFWKMNSYVRLIAAKDDDVADLVAEYCFGFYKCFKKSREEWKEEIKKEVESGRHNIDFTPKEQHYIGYDPFPHQLKPNPGFAEWYDKTHKKGVKK